MNIDELWWTYRCLQYLQEMTTCHPPNPAKRLEHDFLEYDGSHYCRRCGWMNPTGPCTRLRPDA